MMLLPKIRRNFSFFSELWVIAWSAFCAAAQNFLRSRPNFIRQLNQKRCSLPKQIRQPCWILSSSEGVLNYADVIYDVMSKKSASQLQAIQNSCLRICLNCDKRSNVHEMHKIVKVCSLSDRRLCHSSNLVYRGLENTSTPKVLITLLSWCRM